MKERGILEKTFSRHAHDAICTSTISYLAVSDITDLDSLFGELLKAGLDAKYSIFLKLLVSTPTAT